MYKTLHKKQGSVTVQLRFARSSVTFCAKRDSSGQTVVAMPIMAPLADVVGVTRQMAVLTLQYGDGFTNLFLPTNVNLMACLAMAGVDFKRWMKFLVPCYAILFVIMVASIFIGTAIGF